MQSIHLQTATLRAYTRVPFYTDYVRDASSNTIEEFDTTASYVRKNGVWERLDTSVLGNTVEEFEKTVKELQGDVSKITLYFDDVTNQMIFVPAKGPEQVVTLPGANVDQKTIGLGYRNQMYVIDTADEKTIKITDEVREPLESDPDVLRKVSGKLRVEGIYADQANEYITGQQLFDTLNELQGNVKDLEEFTQGSGGFLDPYTFYPDDKYNTTGYPLHSTRITEPERNIILTRYAQDHLPEGKEITEQTKIKDTSSGGHIWVWNGSTWLDNGVDTIVDANNYGVKGAVTGTAYDVNDPYTKFKISIEEDSNHVPTGVMSVNGLKEEFQQVVYKTDEDVTATSNTYVKRSSTGSVAVGNAMNDYDAINMRQFNNAVLSSDDIYQIVNDLFLQDIHLNV